MIQNKQNSVFKADKHLRDNSNIYFDKKITNELKFNMCYELIYDINLVRVSNLRAYAKYKRANTN